MAARDHTEAIVAMARRGHHPQVIRATLARAGIAIGVPAIDRILAQARADDETVPRFRAPPGSDPETEQRKMTVPIGVWRRLAGPARARNLTTPEFIVALLRVLADEPVVVDNLMDDGGVP